MTGVSARVEELVRDIDTALSDDGRNTNWKWGMKCVKELASLALQEEAQNYAGYGEIMEQLTDRAEAAEQRRGEMERVESMALSVVGELRFLVEKMENALAPATPEEPT